MLVHISTLSIGRYGSYPFISLYVKTNPKNITGFVLVYFKESMCLSVSEMMLLVVDAIFPLKIYTYICVMGHCLQEVKYFRVLLISEHSLFLILNSEIHILCILCSLNNMILKCIVGFFIS